MPDDRSQPTDEVIIMTPPIAKAIKACATLAYMAILIVILGWFDGELGGAAIIAGFPAVGVLLLAALVWWIYPHEKNAVREFEEAQALAAEMDGRM